VSLAGTERLWREPSGRWRRVRVVGESRRTATVEYFDNGRRGRRAERGGRVAVRAERVRVVVRKSELRVPEEGWR